MEPFAAAKSERNVENTALVIGPSIQVGEFGRSQSFSGYFGAFLVPGHQRPSPGRRILRGLSVCGAPGSNKVVEVERQNFVDFHLPCSRLGLSKKLSLGHASERREFCTPCRRSATGSAVGSLFVHLP